MKNLKFAICNTLTKNKTEIDKEINDLIIQTRIEGYQRINQIDGSQTGNNLFR